MEVIVRTPSLILLSSLVAASVSGCATPDPTPADPASPEVAASALPFPHGGMIEDGRLALPVLPAAATPFPVDRLRWRDGFSPVQSTVIPMPVAVDPATLPGVDDVGIDAASVQIWDLTTGERVPAFAELDAHPDHLDAPRPLLVRPAAPMTVGHEIAVVLTDALTDVGGAPLAQLQWWAASLAGAPPEGMPDPEPLSDTLDSLGVSGVVGAVSFPVGDGTTPLRWMLEDLPVPDAWSFEVDESVDDDGVSLPEGTWRRLRGSFTTASWLEDGAFNMGPSGVPLRAGSEEAELYVHFPNSVRDADPGTVPVWIFGHGIFGEPNRYLGDLSNADIVPELAEAAGAIVLATSWRGLGFVDISTPVQVGSDFGRIPELTDKLAQGVANVTALARLALEGDLLDDPRFEGLPRRGDVAYYGISLGAIQGAIVLSQVPDLGPAVLHVGGSTWSTMLERSKNWTSFEGFVVGSVLDPLDRQRLYAASQLFWDVADPALYARELVGRDALWQIASADDQVPNLTSWTLARGIGAPILEPTDVAPFGLSTTAAPADGPVFVWYDTERPSADADNRPAASTRAHDVVRYWPGCKEQTLAYLLGGDGVQAQHFCGDEPCRASQVPED